jgi:hypothetical protein
MYEIVCKIFDHPIYINEENEMNNKNGDDMQRRKKLWP